MIQSRREFLKTAIRRLALIGIAATTGYLALRNTDNEKCEFNYVCSKCKKLKNCKLKKNETF